MTRIIDADDVMNVLEGVVGEKPHDYTYQSEFGGGTCQYVVGEKPACIVGKALIDGMRLEWPTYSGGEYVNGGFSIFYGLVQEKNDVEFTRDALILLGLAQRIQDNGGTWRDALATAWNAHDMMLTYDQGDV